MNEWPKITIGMTSYFAEATIGDAIKSAIDQDYPNTEIIIVDDCSGDRSRAVIREAIEGRKNIRLIEHEVNTGFSGALNTIINNATGVFLAIFDDDDISLPERIRSQYARITDYEKAFKTQLVLCHAARIQKYEHGAERYEKTIGTKKGLAPYGEDVAKRILIGMLSGQGNNIVGSCANCARMGRLQIFNELDGFDATMRRAEDTDFSIRFALAGGHFIGLERPLVYQAMTRGEEKTLNAEFLAEEGLLRKHQSYLQSIGWYEFVISWLDIRYAYFKSEWMNLIVLTVSLSLRFPIKTVKKIYWSLPAASTRTAYKNWQKGNL